MSSAIQSATPPAVVSPTSAATPSAAPTSSSTAATTTATTAETSSTSSVATSSSSSSSSSVSTKPTSVTSTSTSSTPTTTTTTTSKTSSSSSISFILQTSNGQVFTQTAVVTIPNPTSTATSGNRSSGGFFHNTGAVAATFSVAAVVGLALLFFLLTSIIRRRRARKFDREIDEAAAAAANAQAPDFDDFDYTSGTGTGYGHYSETSHGTYNQPPLSHEPTRGNLHDMPTSFEAYNVPTGAGAGAAGIGARGRSLHGGRQPDPYGALANPPEQYEMHETRGSWQQGNPNGGAGAAPYDILHAAGLAGSDPYAVTRKASTTLSHSLSQSGISALTRSQSQGASTMPTTAEGYPTSTPPGYPGVPDAPYPPEKARYSASYAPGGGISTMPPDEEDAYGGYNDQPSVPLDNPHSPAIRESHSREDGMDDVVGRYEDGSYLREPEEPARASIADDEDYGFSGRRVLRVANE